MNTAAPSPSTDSATLVATLSTPWQDIGIYHHPIYGHQLVIDGDLQISESDRAYNTAMVAPLTAAGAMEEVAILGGGDGGVLNELLSSADQLGQHVQRATLVDIDAEVIRLSEQYLKGQCGEAFSDPRAEVIIGDAFDFIDQAQDLDAVIYDLTMEPIREHQERSEFIQETIGRVSAALRPGGIFSMQCCGEPQMHQGGPQDHAQLMADIRAAVDGHLEQAQIQTVIVPSYQERWHFLAARKPA